MTNRSAGLNMSLNMLMPNGFVLLNRHTRTARKMAEKLVCKKQRLDIPDITQTVKQKKKLFCSVDVQH